MIPDISERIMRLSMIGIEDDTEPKAPLTAGHK